MSVESIQKQIDSLNELRKKIDEMKWEEIPNAVLGWCVKKIIGDDLKLSKKTLKQALETFYDVVVID